MNLTEQTTGTGAGRSGTGQEAVMAEYSFSGAVEPHPARIPVRARLARWANYVGALSSLALLVGIGVWGTKIVLRDVSEIPIVRAAEGPMRIAPEKPGGETADHQGLAVNAVAGSGVAARPADTLRLAPVLSDLAEEDVAFAEIVPETGPGDDGHHDGGPSPLPSLAELTGTPEPDAEAAGMPDAVASEEDPFADIQAFADRLARESMAFSDVSADPAVAEPAIQALETIPRSVPGVAVSLRPSIRPAAFTPRTVTLADTQPRETPELAASEIAEGTRLVQFGAFDSPDAARAEWRRLQTRFGDYLEGHARVIEEASSGGTTFYRLRAHGFDTVSDARRFCAAFVADNTDCIPVVAR